MSLFDKIKGLFVEKVEGPAGGCSDHSLEEDDCAPDKFDDYTEVDSTKVDSTEGAPK